MSSTNQSSKSSVGRFSKLFAGWKPFIEQPVSKQELEKLMVSASIPSFGYFLMLFLSTIIATFGLISNSAPAIIGAMIIAPLMAPVISFSFGINNSNWVLASRSMLTILSGTLIVIGLSFLCTWALGLRITESEILNRTSPTLLDLGIAMAAGAAAAFSYTRKSILNSIAGVAIAVALLPPLAVTGIGLAYGIMEYSETGLSLAELGAYTGSIGIAEGSFLLFLINLVGIILVSCITLLTQGFGHWRKAIISLLIVCLVIAPFVNPLQNALKRLFIKSTVLEMVVKLPEKYPQIFNKRGRIDAINVDYDEDIIYVELEGVTPRQKPELTEAQLKEAWKAMANVFQKKLKKKIDADIIVEVNMIPVDLITARSDNDITQ